MSIVQLRAGLLPTTVNTGGGAADFARARVIDEFIQLRGDFVRFSLISFVVPFRRRQFRNHLGQAADDVERIAGFMGQAGRPGSSPRCEFISLARTKRICNSEVAARICHVAARTESIAKNAITNGVHKDRARPLLEGHP